MKLLRLFIANVSLWTIATPACIAEDADLVLRGGTIVTVDRQQPTAEAIATRGNRIAAVGSNQDIDSLLGASTRVIELDGRLAIPGFIEGHGHFASLGYSKMMLDLTSAREWDEIVAQVAQAAKTSPPGTWIVGRGWHQAKGERPPQPNVDGYPTHHRLSEVTPQHPVMLTHASGHMNFANRRAMELAMVLKGDGRSRRW